MLSDKSVETVRCGADNGVWGIAYPWTHHLRHTFRLCHFRIVLTGKQHEFPPAVIATARYDGSRAIGIALHQRQILQIGLCGNPGIFGKLYRAMNLGVDDQPRFLKIKGSASLCVAELS